MFHRPHLDYDDIIYDQAYNLSFHQKLESFQYNATLALTGAVSRSSREKLSRAGIRLSSTATMLFL